MEFDLDHAVAVLSRTPTALKALLAGLPREWIRNNEGPETWSPYDVLGHLVHLERTDWIPRARIILEHGEARTFDPVDRFAQFAESQGKTLEELLVEFAALREQSLMALGELKVGAAELEMTGWHPALGRAKLKELLATWVAHDLDHLGQIARTMAKQYTREVGPWEAYLSILGDRQLLPAADRR
ncbi:MAG: DinB family protein [Acidobacteria bacterium]|nr:DinB family protein [Acidobacteriota bacterium]